MTAQLNLKLETAVKPLPTDSTILVRSRSALGLKYVEITKGTADKGFADGVDHAAGPRHAARRSSSTRCSARSTTRRARRRATNLQELRRRARRPRRDLNIAIAGLQPVAAQPHAGHANNLVDPRTRLVPTVPGAGSHGAEIAPVAETQAVAVRQPRHHVRRDRPRALRLPGLDHRRPAGAGRRHPLAARAAAVPGQQRPACSQSCDPASARCRPRRPTWPTRFEVGAGSLRRSVALNRRLKPTFAALQRFAEDPLVALGVHDLTNTSQILEPTVTHLAPVQTVCNYITLWFRNVALAAVRGRPERHLAALHHHRGAAAATTTRAARPPSPPTGPTRPAQLPAHQPVPQHRLAGAADGVRGGQRALHARQGAIGNSPGNQGTRHDETTISKGRHAVSRLPPTPIRACARSAPGPTRSWSD